MKKFIKRFFMILIMIILLFTTSCFAADDVDFKKQIKKEDGSLFEKIIAECIGGIAQTVFDLLLEKRLM